MVRTLPTAACRPPTCPAPIKVYDPATPIGPHEVLYLEMRAGRAYSFEARIRDSLTTIDATPSGQLAPACASFAVGGMLRPMVDRGFRNNDFRDTTLPASWLGSANHFAGLDSAALPPLTLTLVHAETHMRDVYDAIVKRGQRPAGAFMSGSPKFVDECIGRDESVTLAVGLVTYFMAENIPFFGHCFGMQLLTYAAFTVFVEPLTVPTGMHSRVIATAEPRRETIPLTAGTRHHVFGVATLDHQQSTHPFLRGAEGVTVLKSHSQFLSPGHSSIPPDNILATSQLMFCDGTNPAATTTLPVVEIIQAGASAFGVQGHCEATGALFETYAQHPDLLRDLLELNGYDRAQLARVFRAYDAAAQQGKTGAQYGLNFVFRYVLQHYLAQLHPTRRNDRMTVASALAGLDAA